MAYRYILALLFMTATAQAMESDQISTTHQKIATLLATPKPKAKRTATQISSISSSSLQASQDSTPSIKKTKQPLTQESFSLSQMLAIEADMIAETASIHPLLQPQKTGSYNVQRKSNMYDANKPFNLSRSKLENFIQCPRCFYIDRKCGTSAPSGPAFSLNIAVDNNMKNEFDIHRANQTMHPYCIAYDAIESAKENGQPIHAIPFQHKNINDWRNSLYKGLRHHVQGTNIELHGGIDDIWQNQETKELIIVDYKATAKKGPITLDAPWQNSYKRQMAIYQYLARKNLEKEGYKVSNTGFFVYANAQAGEHDDFNDQLNFQTTLLAYEADDSWVEPTVKHAYTCLQADTMPASSEFCEMCQFTSRRTHHEAEFAKNNMSSASSSSSSKHV